MKPCSWGFGLGLAGARVQLDDVDFPSRRISKRHKRRQKAFKVTRATLNFRLSPIIMTCCVQHSPEATEDGPHGRPAKRSILDPFLLFA